jgi:hypothetical protein
MSADRLEVSVTFDAERGYVATAAELRQPVLALSLGGVRRRVEERLIGEDLEIRPVLDRAARLERGRRRAKITATSAARSRAGFPS